MSTVVIDVESAALELAPERRARLVVRLLESLDTEPSLSREEVERLWLQEAEERLRQLERGEAAPVPAEQVFARARKNLV
jgi:hypothetical protein